MSHRNAGLSYLEVLISLAIMAMIGALTVAAIGFARNTGLRVAQTAAMETSVVLRSALRSWLEAARPETDHTAFIASADRFGFWLDRPPDALPQIARLRVTVVVQHQDGAVDIIFELHGVDRDGNISLSETRTLYAGLQGAALLYLPRSADPDAVWVNALADGDIPALIRLEARVSDDISIPPLIVQPTLAYRDTIISLAAPSPPG